MKKIVCDLCGESDFLKVEGFFVCQVCGAKYTIDEARDMMKEVSDSSSSADQALADDDENAVRRPTRPTVVRKVVVAPRQGAQVQTKDQAAKRIISNVRRAEPEQPQVQGKRPVIIKKVVVKPRTSTPVQQQQQATPKPSPVLQQNLETRPGMGVSQAQMIENLFVLSQNAFDSENYVDAENYANRIIELDSTNSDAWLMKGNCASKQTDGDKFRFLESINCWNTCLVNAAKDEVEDYQFTVRTNCIDGAVAYILKNCKAFVDKASNENFQKVIDKIEYVDPMMRKANQTFGVQLSQYEDKLASNISAIVTSISKNEIKEFGKRPEQQTEAAYAKFIEIQDACIFAWNYLMDIAKKHGTVTAILSNIVKMHEAIIRNVGHTVQSNGKVKVTVKCSMSERNKRLELIKQAKKKLEDKFVDIRKRDRVDQKFKNAKYWEEHQEEKQQLLDERQKLDHEIFELENSKLKMEELNELKKLEEESVRLSVLKDNPTYSNKERTAYMDQLNKIKKQIVTKKRELASRLNPIDDKIEKYKKRMFNIDLELNQNR